MSPDEIRALKIEYFRRYQSVPEHQLAPKIRALRSWLDARFWGPSTCWMEILEYEAALLAQRWHVWYRRHRFNRGSAGPEPRP